MRRSTAQKFIKHFDTLGVDAFIIADVMLYTIEIAQALTAEKEIKSVAFYKSMLSSFEQAVAFLIEKGILNEFKNRVVAINNQTIIQNWENNFQFNAIIERLEY